MNQAIAFGDIVEENGKTIHQNNQEKPHNIPLGALVEVQYDDWYGEGACAKVTARLFVVHQGRDCDGTPLYWLSSKRPGTDQSRKLLYCPDEDFGGKGELPGGLPGVMFNEEFTRKLLDNWKGGFNETSLTVIEQTEAIKRGEKALRWEK